MGTSSHLQRAGALLRIRSPLGRECLAELLAVFVLMVITLAGAAQKVTSSNTKGDAVTAYLAGALAVMMAIYTAGGVSGAHLNPAFSFALCLLEGFPWWKLPIFAVLQTLGAFLASAAVFGVYYEAILHYGNGTLTTSGPQETASIFATYPADYLSLFGGFLDQVLATALLLLGIQALRDGRNKGVPAELEPVAVALLVLALEVSLGANCGCPMNPARDLGPRLFTFVAGWGWEVFRGNGWWWVPVVAPMVGGALGSVLYQLFVGFHHPPADRGDPLTALGSSGTPPEPSTAPASKDGSGGGGQLALNKLGWGPPPEPTADPPSHH